MAATSRSSTADHHVAPSRISGNRAGYAGAGMDHRLYTDIGFHLGGQDFRRRTAAGARKSRILEAGALHDRRGAC